MQDTFKSMLKQNFETAKTDNADRVPGPKSRFINRRSPLLKLKEFGIGEWYVDFRDVILEKLVCVGSQWPRSFVHFPGEPKVNWGNRNLPGDEA